MVRRFSLSKLLRMSLRRGRVIRGMEMSRTSQRVTLAPGVLRLE